MSALALYLWIGSLILGKHNVGLMLVQCRRRWTNTIPALGQHVVCCGIQWSNPVISVTPLYI